MPWLRSKVRYDATPIDPRTTPRPRPASFRALAKRAYKRVVAEKKKPPMTPAGATGGQHGAMRFDSQGRTLDRLVGDLDDSRQLEKKRIAIDSVRVEDCNLLATNALTLLRARP